MSQKNLDNILVDSHCHLLLVSKVTGRTLNDIIDCACQDEVCILNTICTNFAEIPDILKVCKKYQNVFGSIGIHPSEITEKFITVEEILGFLEEDKLCSIGETGLDYHFEPYDKHKQKKNFEIHIEAARKSGLPLIIHNRDSDCDMIDILDSEIKNGEFSFVLHSFCSSKELAYKALDLNGYISLSGILTFKNSLSLQDIVKNLPLNRIFLETDAPFLAPVPLRGTQNESRNVKHVAKFLSELINIDYDIVVKVTTHNFLNCFKKISQFINNQNEPLWICNN